MIVFKYKEESLGAGKGTIKRPVADIYLKSSSGSWIEFHPYIDSGADLTMIPISLGRLLGLHRNERKVDKIGGIRGSVPVNYTKTQMRIGEYEFQSRIAWALIENVPPLLGRADVFDIFNIEFKQCNEQVIFQKR